MRGERLNKKYKNKKKFTRCEKEYICGGGRKEGSEFVRPMSLVHCYFT